MKGVQTIATLTKRGIVRQISPDESFTSFTSLGYKFLIFLRKSSLSIPGRSDSWYYVVSAVSRFPHSPITLSHSSVLTVHAHSGAVSKSFCEDGVRAAALPLIHADMAVRHVHES
jgi:hypothetical protein